MSFMKRYSFPFILILQFAVKAIGLGCRKKDNVLTFRCWIKVGFVFLIGFQPVLVSSADRQKLEKLVIGYPAPVASLGIIDVMRKAGLFKKYGLDVDLVYIQGSPILTAAMVSGQVPLSFLGGAAIVASAVGGADTVYLACGINTLYWRLFSTPDVKTLEYLKGKKIGLITMGSQEDAVMRLLLKERGVIPDRDVSFLAVGAAPTRLAALTKGVVQASVFIPPQDIAAEKLSLYALIDMSRPMPWIPASSGNWKRPASSTQSGQSR